jgi:amino acid transporter
MESEATMSLLRFVLGRPLANKEYKRRRIGAFEGVPAMGLDALGSSAYGPEAALSILVPLGLAAPAHLGTVMVPILVLLGVLYVSYRQTIRAYPTNGGAYTVARENLGANASLLAAAALMIDYILNVAVGISAGVGALVSAVPALQPYTLHTCLLILALLTVVNLRGTLDAGRLFALPTYAFVGSFLLLIAIGLWNAATSGGAPTPVASPPQLPQAAAAANLWLLLRAFAAGCTAMTGVEAVSNAVGSFREPTVRFAQRTLTFIVVVLGLLLAGIAYLVAAFHIGAMDQSQPGYQSVLSQLASAVVGRNWFYYFAIASLLCVLALSADTSFTGFPRLCRLIAQDGFLPRPFAIVGRRLVFSVGILCLAGAAGLLLIAFDGITDRLIPLFAIGAFLTFTLSQAGMVAHWLREMRRSPGAPHRFSFAVNALGVTVTAVALVVIVVAKFAEGAWITLIAVPAVITLFKLVRRYYDMLDAQLREDVPPDLRAAEPPIVLVATEGWNKLTDKAVAFALTVSSDVYAVHLSVGEDNEREQELRSRWARNVEEPARRAGLVPPKLLIVEAPYRRPHVPILKLVEKFARDQRERTIAVLLPEIVKQTWWQHLLHAHRARRLEWALLKSGIPRLVVMTVPWHLERPQPEADFEEEERRIRLHVKTSAATRP